MLPGLAIPQIEGPTNLKLPLYGYFVAVKKFVRSGIFAEAWHWLPGVTTIQKILFYNFRYCRVSDLIIQYLKKIYL